MRNERASALALLEALAGDQGSASSTPALPLPTAQAAELHLVQSQINHGRLFYRGEFVRFIHRAGPIKEKFREKVVFLFWTELQVGSDLWKHHAASMTEAEKATVPNPDCLLAHFAASGDLAFQIADSSMLEVYTPQD